MKKNILLVLAAVVLVSGFVLVAGDQLGAYTSAQTTIPAPTPEVPKMPEVVTLGKDAKLGQVTFNHVKHNGGTYNITPGTPIACIDRKSVV